MGRPSSSGARSPLSGSYSASVAACNVRNVPANAFVMGEVPLLAGGGTVPHHLAARTPQQQQQQQQQRRCWWRRRRRCCHLYVPLLGSAGIAKRMLAQRTEGAFAAWHFSLDSMNRGSSNQAPLSSPKSPARLTPRASYRGGAEFPCSLLAETTRCRHDETRTTNEPVAY